MCNVRICGLGERKIWSVDLSNFLVNEAYQFCIQSDRNVAHMGAWQETPFSFDYIVGRSAHKPLSPTEGEESWIDQIAGTKAHD